MSCLYMHNKHIHQIHFLDEHILKKNLNFYYQIERKILFYL